MKRVQLIVSRHHLSLLARWAIKAFQSTTILPNGGLENPISASIGRHHSTFERGDSLLAQCPNAFYSRSRHRFRFGIDLTVYRQSHDILFWESTSILAVVHEKRSLRILLHLNREMSQKCPYLLGIFGGGVGLGVIVRNWSDWNKMGVHICCILVCSNMFDHLLDFFFWGGAQCEWS